MIKKKTQTQTPSKLNRTKKLVISQNQKITGRWHSTF
jgi:hypothetical protein